MLHPAPLLFLSILSIFWFYFDSFLILLVKSFRMFCLSDRAQSGTFGHLSFMPIGCYLCMFMVIGWLVAIWHNPHMLHALLCHGHFFFPFILDPITAVYSQCVLDMNTLSCVVAGVLYTLTVLSCPLILPVFFLSPCLCCLSQSSSDTDWPPFHLLRISVQLSGLHLLQVLSSAGSYCYHLCPPVLSHISGLTLDQDATQCLSSWESKKGTGRLWRKDGKGCSRVGGNQEADTTANPGGTSN